MTEEQRIDLEYLHRSSNRRLDPVLLAKSYKQEVADARAEKAREEKRNHVNKVQMWILAGCLAALALPMLVVQWLQ